MAQTRALGDGPVLFSRSDGRQLSIPLSDIVFEGNVPKSLSNSDDDLDAWLAYLTAQGRLWPDTAAAAATALTLSAHKPGATGNTITVIIAPSNADPSKLDVTVTETDVYDGLTFEYTAGPTDPRSSVMTQLGIAGVAAGTRPGLVQFVGPRPASAAAVIPVIAASTCVVSPPSTQPTIKVMSPPAVDPAFSLIAREADSDDTAIWTAGISNVDPIAKTFTLTVRWRKTVPLTGTGDLGALKTAMKFVVDITLPSNLVMPAVGTTQLTGGADLLGPFNATGTVLASP